MEILGRILVIIIILSFLIGVATIILNLVKKKKSKITKVYFITCGVSIVALLIVALTATSNDAEPQANSTAQETDVDDGETSDQEAQAMLDDEIENTVVDWESEIKQIAKSNGSATEKYDAVEEFAATYPAVDETVEEFTDDIISNFKSGSYLANSEEEFLTQIFKATTVEQNTSGGVKEFAFDYWQVQKYVYRGAEKPNSQFVESNEYQMNKSLQSIK